MAGLTLHDYQRTAVGHLRLHQPGAGLFMEMGLGKTISTLTALRPEHLPALVVAPKRVAENVWHAEVARWDVPLRVVVAKGRPQDRARELAKAASGAADVVVLGRDNHGDVERLWPRRRHPFKTVVLDELSGYKTRGSARWTAARKLVLGPACERVWGLTGTPTPNGLMDLWAQVVLLDRGARLGKTLTGYRETYFTPRRSLPNGVIPGWDPLPGAEEAIFGLLEDICLSMKAADYLTLPDVVHNRISVPLPAKVMTAYRRLKKLNIAQLDEVLGRNAVTTADTAAAVSNRLSQMAAGFVYPNSDDLAGGLVAPGTYTELHREKVQAVLEVIEGTGSPVLVAYRYKAELEMLRQVLGPRLYTADTPDLQERWNAGQLPVLAAHPQSLGHGLNLQYGGHTIVWMSPTWSLEEWQQFNGRLPRQGQGHPVVIHTVVAESTVDEAIMEALAGKASVQDALLAHLESPL